MGRQHYIVVALVWSVSVISTWDVVLAQEWQVTNDYDETFVLYVRSARQRRYPYKRYEIRPNQSARIQLGEDPHDLQVGPKGGKRVELDPLYLSDRGQAKLTDVLSPRRRNDRTVYVAMQNDGYQIDKDYLDMIRKMQQSSWICSFANPSGGSFDRVVLNFNGSTGNYRSNEIEGKMTDVMYTPDPDASEIIIDGSWASNRGRRGRFVFRVPFEKPNTFVGERNGNFDGAAKNDWYPWTAVRQQR